MKNNYKAVIIGGGASGLLCAVELLRGKNALKGCDFLILERNDRVGKKLIATGNGQGNLCNSLFSADYYHGDQDFINEFIDNAKAVNIEQYLCDLGIPLTKEEGKRYPISKQSSAVLDIIRLFLSSQGVEVLTGEKALSVISRNQGYTIETDKSKYNAQNVVLAFGGKVGKQFGTDGTSYHLATNLGHKISKLYPSLVQLKTDLTKVRGLKGLKEKVKLTAKDGEKVLKSTVGEILFTEFGVSGNAVFTLSAYLTDAKNPNLKIEFMPEYSQEEIENIITQRQKLGYFSKEDYLKGLINKRIGQMVIKNIQNVTPKELAKSLKNFTLTVTGNLDFNYAQVTKGGIIVSDVNANTMESKINEGLFITGEALDVDGDCGGYNLTFAFVTGILSARKIKQNFNGIN